MSADDTERPSFTEEAIADTFARLPAHHRAMLRELDERAHAWGSAPERARYLAVSYGVSIQVAQRIDREMTEALAKKMDHATFHGAPDIPTVTPREVHARLLGHDGAHPGEPPMREEGAGGPDVTQNENDSQVDRGPDENGSQPTPVQRRDAWLRIHRGLVHDAERQLRAIRLRLPYVNHPPTRRAHLADEWAALQLLKHLRDMKAPEVPVDDTLGQATLEDALRGADAGTGLRTMLAQLEKPNASGCRGECGVQHGPEGGCL